MLFECEQPFVGCEGDYSLAVMFDLFIKTLTTLSGWEMGAFSRMGAYLLFGHSEWALIN